MDLRFEFGENWTKFSKAVGQDRVNQAMRSLQDMLEVEDLRGKSFLDIGSGSGLFSLAATRLGASRVHSFDYDPQSVACTRELKRRYSPDSDCWTIEEGSVLDAAYLTGLGQFDIIYSWGVLHHTGNLWQALENLVPLCAAQGMLALAIYNDQGGTSRRWRTVKHLYNKSPVWRMLVCGFFIPYFVAQGLLIDLLRRKNPLSQYRTYYKNRGMSRVRDWLDWLGGYPFEVARPEAIFDWYRKRGFNLTRLKTCGGGLGNNEFVFVKCAE